MKISKGVIVVIKGQIKSKLYVLLGSTIMVDESVTKGDAKPQERFDEAGMVGYGLISVGSDRDRVARGDNLVGLVTQVELVVNGMIQIRAQGSAVGKQGLDFVHSC